LSCLADDVDRAPHDISAGSFAPFDHYFLQEWCEDLAPMFPFLSYDPDRPAYDLFYLLWRLSYLYGVRDADQSICFEDLVTNPKKVLDDLAQQNGLDPFPASLAEKMSTSAINRHRSYGHDSWLTERESVCESLLESFIEVVTREHDFRLG
jgi:hypothetical protein